MPDDVGFLSQFSHELRAHLGLIRNYAEILIGNPPASRKKVVEFLSVIRDESEYLARLLEDLVIIERMERGVVTARTGEGSPALALQRCLLDCGEEAADKGIKVHCHIEDGIPRLAVDELLLSKAYAHLLRNAVRFSPRGGAVTVRLRREADGAGSSRIVAEFEDEGIGVPPGEAERIFDKFHRAATPVDGSPDGSGIGLAFVRAVARSLDGSVDLRSAPGEGSSFTLAFPSRTR